jgi:dTMP kinase
MRHVILDSGTTGLAPLAEMALMFASRAQHIQEVIAPALAEGKIVLCDRFTDSTEAYQGSGRKLGSKVVLELHRILCDDLQPDLTLLMDSDVAVSVERARRRNQKTARNGRERKDENRFEQESRAFFTRVRQGYMAIARRESDRVLVIDARGTPSQTHAKILELVARRLRLGVRT